METKRLFCSEDASTQLLPPTGTVDTTEIPTTHTSEVAPEDIIFSSATSAEERFSIACARVCERVLARIRAENHLFPE